MERAILMEQLLLLMAEEPLGKSLIDSKAMGEMLFSINDILRDIL